MATVRIPRILCKGVLMLTLLKIRKESPDTQENPRKLLTMIIASIGAIIVILTAAILLLAQNVPIVSQ